MSRALVILASRAERERAAHWCHTAPVNTRVEFTRSRRSIPQNAMLWAWLTAFADQAEWAGAKRTPHDWKDLLTAAVKVAGGGVEAVPGLEGGLMLLGLRTSEMTKDEMNDLLTYMESKAAQLGVYLPKEVNCCEDVA